MVDLVKSTFEAVKRQGFEGAYTPQIIPVLGAVVSIPVAVISGVRAIIKLVEAIFKHFKDNLPFFRPKNETMQNVTFPMEDAKDLGLIFADNVANICTLGILNCFGVLSLLSRFVLSKRL